MSRLGDIIKQERLRLKISPKQLAKKSGVSEKYLLDVEAGTRIIADTEATRILKVMGKTTELFADFESKADGLPTPAPAPRAATPAPRPASKPIQPTEPAAAWQDALGGILKAVPIRTLDGQQLGSRTLPVQSGRIESAPADKVFYLQVQDNQMAGYRIRQNDLILVVPAMSPKDNAIMVVLNEGVPQLRRIKLQDNNRCLLQWYDYEPHSEVAEGKKLLWQGRAVRVEFEV